MRMIGHRIGAPTTVATRMSVIFSSDGLELVLTRDCQASSCSSAQKVAAAAAPRVFNIPRRLGERQEESDQLSSGLFHVKSLTTILYQQPHRIAIDGKEEHRMRVGVFTALVVAVSAG